VCRAVAYIGADRVAVVLLLISQPVLLDR
jgi:hypothetical protein